MASHLIEYQLRIRDAADSTDAITITSVRGGTNPYLSAPPQGDGASFDPLTCESLLGTYTGRIADWSIGGAQRVVTSQLEDGTTFRQLLGFRKAIQEFRIDGGAWTVMIAGYLTLLRLVNAAEFEYTISDPMSAQIVAQLFAPTSDTTIAAFLAAWPNRGCLVGGPIIAPAVTGHPAQVLGITDLGGWTMQVETSGIANEYYLRPKNVYGPPNWHPQAQIDEDLAGAINGAIAQLQTSFADGAADSWTTIADAQSHYWAWPGVTVLIDDGSGVKPWKPLAFFYSRLADDNGNPVAAPIVSPVKGDGGSGIRVKSDGTRTLSNGAIVKVRVITVLPSEMSPIYVTGHPIDLLTTFWTTTNLPFDATACAALKTAMAGAFMAFRITAPKDLADLVQTICSYWGLGIRGNTSGQLQPFQGRIVGNTPPTTTITAADVVEGSTSLPFELDPSKAVQTLTIAQKIFSDQRNTPLGTKGSIVDGVVAIDDTATFINGDASAVAFGSFDISLDAQVTAYSNSATKASTLAAFGTSIAQTIFDRFGHGAVALETTLIRGGAGDSVNLGDEVLVQLPQLPNHNYRLGDNGAVAARAMQVVRRTVTPSGYEVRLVDSGPNAQPLATVPTVSIAASSDAPRTVAIVTITNAATLNALGYGARLQWGMTFDGTVPPASTYTDVQAWKAGAIPSTFRLPPAAAGATVYVRARSEGVATSRPSNYGTAAGLTLSIVADPTGLTATPSGTDGSKCALAWTAGSGTSADLVDIWRRASGAAFSTAVRVATLNPGSVAYTLEGLTPGVAYTASVQYRDPRTQDLSDPVDVTFTAGATTFTLPAPVLPQGFSGSLNATGVPNADGVYGMAVVAALIPGFVEVAIAIETAIGSGTYGSFVTSAKVASVSGNWTIASFVAPNDGLRRQLKARHVGDGASSSAYTSVVTVKPWTPTPLPPLPSTPVVEATFLAPTEPGVNVIVEITGVDPFGTTPQVMVKSLSGTSVAIITGAAVGTLAANNSTWKISQPPAGAGPGSMVINTTLADGRTASATVSIPEQASSGIAIPQGTVSIDAGGRTGFTTDGLPSTNSIKWLVSTSSYPSDASVIASGNILTGGRTFTATNIITLAFGQTAFVTIVGFTGASGTGTSQPSIHLQGSYQSFSATKTVTYSRTSWVDRGTLGFTSDADGSVINAALPSGTIRDDFAMTAILPQGVTLVSAAFDVAWNTATNALGGFTASVSTVGSNINFASPSYGGGSQTLTMTLGSTVVGSGAILFRNHWGNALGPGTADAGQGALYDVRLTYTQPDPAHTV